MPRMRRLPWGTAAGVRAAARYPTWASLVYGLLVDALQQGATRIDIGVDLEAWTLTCRHNGEGHPHGMCGVHEGTLADAAALALLDLDWAAGGKSYTLLQRGGHVLYAGIAPPQRSRRGGCAITLRDLYATIPVRRRVLESRKRAELRRMRQCVVALALCHPSVSFSLSTRSSRLVHAPRVRALEARARSVSAAFLPSKQMHKECVVGTWHIALDGCTGTMRPTPSQQHISLNGTPVPRDRGVRSTVAAREARHADVYPWQDSAAYDRIWAGDRSLHAHVERLLDPRPRRPPHDHLAYVLNVRIQPSAHPSTEPVPRTWYALFSTLLGEAHDTPRPLRPIPPHTSRFFTKSIPRPRAPLMQRMPATAEAAPMPPAAVLQSVRVVGQVDKKYIACTYDDTPALLLIDQHAADERVKLEQLVTSYVLACLEAKMGGLQTNTHVCTAPLTIAAAFAPAHLRAIRFWGFDLVEHGDAWLVRGVPTVLARLGTDAPLLHRVLAAFCEQSPGDVDTWLTSVAHTPRSTSSALSALRHLPALAVHLVLTHVCHSAIRTLRY